MCGFMTNCYFKSDISHLLVRTLAKLCKCHSQTKNSTDCVVPWQSWSYLCRYYYSEAKLDYTHTHTLFIWLSSSCYGPLRRRFLGAMVRSVAQIIHDWCSDMWVGVARSGWLCLSTMWSCEGYFQTVYQSEINCSANVHQTRLHLPALVVIQFTAQGLP
jgi:hypothetical protein